MALGKSKKRAKLRAEPSFPMASSSSATPAPHPTSVAAVAKKGFLRRILPFLLTANLAVGVYVLARTWNKQSPEKEKEATEETSPSTAVVNTETSASEKTTSDVSFPARVSTQFIPENEQLELFKWILQEKQKVKPRDSSEKKKIEEEKAFLKQVIRSGSIPNW